jgi:hypothetical protein
MAEDWLQSGLVSECLVIGAEEADWLTLEAGSYYAEDWIGSEGAGALLLSLSGSGPRVTDISGPHVYRRRRERLGAIERAAVHAEGMRVVDRRVGVDKLDADEAKLFAGRESLSPLVTLGDSLGAASVLQVVLAAQLAGPSLVSLPGTTGAACSMVVSGL